MPSDASQYHAQDAFGQYQYGYSNPLSAKNEIKTADGITRGSYSYIDSNGQLQTVSYIADPLNGFRVAATNLPVAPQAVQIPDAPDVAAAKEELFRLQDAARNTLSEESLAEPNIEWNMRSLTGIAIAYMLHWVIFSFIVSGETGLVTFLRWYHSQFQFNPSICILLVLINL